MFVTDSPASFGLEQKDGFLSCSDLQLPLQLFLPHELTSLLCVGHWGPTCDQLIGCLDFSQWAGSSELPATFRSILRNWSPRQRELLLRWGTGSERVHKGTLIAVERSPSAKHFPSAASCTLTLTLPDLRDDEMELERRLQTSMQNMTFNER